MTDRLPTASEQSLTGTVTDRLERAPPVYVIAPPPTVLRAVLLSVFDQPPVEADADPPLRIVAEKTAAQACRAAFRVGHQTVELLARDVVGIHTVAESSTPDPLVVDEAAARTVVALGDRYALFEAPGTALERTSLDIAASVWERGRPLSTGDRRAWRPVAQGLVDRTDRTTLGELETLLNARYRAQDGHRLDIPTTALLAGAATDASQKAIAAWCEQFDIAAGSTVSTRKQRLVAAGLVETVPVAGSVGAPTHHLRLADDYLASMSPAERYDVVADVVSTR